MKSTSDNEPLLHCNVENVEAVEWPNFSLNINKIDQKQLSTAIAKNCVESVEKDCLSEYFSTLSTTIKQDCVELSNHKKELNINVLNNFPQNPQIPQMKNNNLKGSNKNSVILVFDWLELCLKEGHIEPSQPIIGKLVGWPCRNFRKETLFLDFSLWCQKAGLLAREIPSKNLFLSLLDHVFVSSKDSYEFPPLIECRKQFLKLRENYESS